MKLYTEEQLHNTVIAISNYLDDINLTRAQENIEKHLKALQPIELPSDEKIEEYLNSFPYTKHLDDGQYNDGVIVGAELAIQWLLSKIQEGKNE
jgi:hypothetical protein